MSKNLNALTGAQIVKKIRSKNIGSIVFGCFASIGILMFLAFAVFAMREAHYIMGILAVLASALFIWMLSGYLKKAFATLKNVEHCRLFRKYGDPEQLAERIASGRVNTIYTNRNTLVGEDYIMKFGDFESFMPLSAVVLAYRKEHRTNGILDGVFLVCYDQFGDSFDYPFPVSKKHTGEMDMVVNEISRYSPECVFGYTAANVQYAKSCAKQLPEE